MIKSMNFIKLQNDGTLSEEENQLIEDLFLTIFKCENMEQEILAENLESILLVISGDRDFENEVENDTGNKKWRDAGAYNEDTGRFHLRVGEHTPIQAHFKLFKFNRMSQKTVLKSQGVIEKKKDMFREVDSPTFTPSGISQKTAKMSAQRRRKIVGEENTNIQNVLTAP